MTFLDTRPVAGRSPLRVAQRSDRRALACGVAAVLLLAGGLGLLLSRAEQHRSGTNGVLSQAQAIAQAGTTACQAREVLPAGTASMEIAGASLAPPLVVLRRDGHVLARVAATSGPHGNGLRASLTPAARTLDDVQVCLDLRGATVLGRGPTAPGVGTLTADGRALGGSLAIGYLLAGQSRWWQFAGRIAERICGNHADGGLCWVIWTVLGLLAASFVLTGWIVVRTLVRGLPLRRAGVAIAAVAVLNAAAWSLITPAFEVPDEAAHVAYVQSLAETGRAPARPPALTVSPEQAALMRDSGFGSALALSLRAATWTRQQQGRLAADLARPLSRRQTVPQGEAEPEPPLYYALQALPYRLAHVDPLLDRMMLMRLFSALLAGATALLSFLFVRECLPAKPWAWTVGGLGVALAPMLGFVAGGVNPDALLFALSSALFLCVARGWRRGVTTRLALAVGALIAAGMLTKVNFYALVPGALLGLALAARRTTLAWDRRLLGLVGGSGLAAGGMFVAGAAFEALAWHRSVLAARPIAPESHVSLWSHVGYVWQVLLPRLPFQPHTRLTEPGYAQLFRSFIGAFGHMTVWFPGWVYRGAAMASAVIVLLVVRVLHADPRELRWRRGELLGYATMALALMVLVGLSADLRRHLIEIVQGRYLLPLLPLFGALLALGARGAGERWGRPVGVAIVSGAVAWSLFGQLLTIAWFYG